MSVGPWRVFAEVVSATEDEADTLLQQKAVPSMESLFDGRISYYLKISTKIDGDNELLRPLVFIPEFNRQTRPRAWKQADLKIQATLPLVGTDESAEEVPDGARQSLIRVSLCLKKK